MRLLATSALIRGGVTALAGAALLVPLSTTAGAANHQRASAVVPLTAAEAADLGLEPTPLQAPTLSTSTTGQVDPGLLLATPGNMGTGAGPAAIYNNNGQLVWQRSGSYYNLEAVTYRGQPALAVYDVTSQQHLVLDRSYNQIATLRMQNGVPTDAHDIEFSPDGSRVLLQGWASTTYNLSPWGGPSSAIVLEPVIQEQIVGTGQVTFEWRALQHVSPDETTESMTGGFGFFDLFHSNSLEYDADGNILTSFRNTSAVYKIDRNTGEIIWRLGGERSDFTFSNQNDRPSYQHDARRLANGQLSIFNNGNTLNPRESRGVSYVLDESTMTATTASSLRANPAAYTAYIGNNRQVSNGNQLVSFGTTGRMVEFAGTQQVFTGQFSAGWASYRTERATWTSATPTAPPTVDVGDVTEDGSRALQVSWNGATEVASWRIEAGASEDALTTLGATEKTGFETAAQLYAPADADVFRVTALDASGEPLDSRTVSTT